MAQENSKGSRRKKTVKPFTVEEKKILKRALNTMRLNGVKFIKSGSKMKISVEMNGSQKVRFTQFHELGISALIQRANPAIKYKKK